MVTVTIEGTAEQVADALAKPKTAHRIAMERNTARREEILRKRRLVRAAFDLVRHDPSEQLLVSNFAGALGGRLEMTVSLLESARQIIADHSHK